MSPSSLARPLPSGADPVARLWSGRTTGRLIQGPDGLDAAAHSALGPDLLRIAASTGGNVLRCYRPPRTAAFTGLDRLAAGHGRAREVAATHGFAPVQRSQGGRMAAYHRESLCIDLVLGASSTLPDPDPWAGLGALAQVLVELLRRCGVDAQAGEVEGEYCPGRFSVNVDGRVKLAGTAARRVPGATLLSAVLVVGDVEPLRAVTTDVYAALEFPFIPSTVGGADQFAPGLTADTLTVELLDMQSSRVELTEEVLAPTEGAPACNVPDTLTR